VRLIIVGTLLAILLGIITGTSNHIRKKIQEIRETTIILTEIPIFRKIQLRDLDRPPPLD